MYKGGEKIMQSAMTKSVVRDIKNSLGRFISIAAIIALGVSLFSGLKVSQRTMINTADEYFEKNNFYDYKIVSTLGFDEESVYDFVKNDSIIEPKAHIQLISVFLLKMGQTQ